MHHHSFSTGEVDDAPLNDNKDMNEEDIRKFLKEHLDVQVWVDYDVAYNPQINVGLYLDNEKICEASDYLNI